MHFYRLPDACSALILLSLSAYTANAQFSYPPPLDRPLADYTSGEVKSALNFSDGDNMFGGWTTPGHLKSFMLYRCVHTPTTKPIYPSNSSFTSRQGRIAKDGTWEQMPLYEGFDNPFGNGFNPGSNPIWFHGEFFAPNSTTGDLCWFELYPGYDTYETGMDGQTRVATVEGGGPWYFATVPFTVNPRRPSGQTVTWKNDGTERGMPTRNIFSNSSDSTQDSEGAGSKDPDSGALSLGCHTAGISAILFSFLWMGIR